MLLSFFTLDSAPLTDVSYDKVSALLSARTVDGLAVVHLWEARL